LRAVDDPAAALATVAWDFADSTDPALIHRLHPYPARFIPQIPRELIRLFGPGDGSLVLDPFCGSGTTLVEALRAGRPCVGVDLNPLAGLLAKVKTTPLDANLVAVGGTVVQEARSSSAAIPHIPRIDHWFELSVQQALARLTEAIERVQPSDTRDALRVALSRIIVRVSNQESDTRYAAVAKGVDSDEVYRLFARSVAAVDAALREAYGWFSSQRARSSVIVQDVLTLEPTDIGPESVGLVVTSPPYPNAYEYWLYHKYRMYWLGMDPLYVREREIGARPHFFRRNPQTEHDFADQMEKLFALLSKIVRAGGFCCFLVGRSVIHGRVIDNAHLLAKAAAVHGFSLTAHASRRIPRTRKAFNPVNGSIEQESIVVFQFDNSR